MVAVMIFVFGVNIGVGPIPFVLNGEMFAEEAKGLSGTPVQITWSFSPTSDAQSTLV